MKRSSNIKNGDKIISIKQNNSLNNGICFDEFEPAIKSFHVAFQHAVGGRKMGKDVLFENIVYYELCIRGYEIYASKRPQDEVDFVVVKSKKTEYYQMAYYLYNEKTIERGDRSV